MTDVAVPRYAVIGNPIAHSRSPQIHAMFSAQTGRALQYDRLLAPLDGFNAAVQSFAAAGGHGLNITVPFKQEAFTLAAGGQLSERARLAGAVNTLWFQEGCWHGCNTDGIGLVSDLQRLKFTLNNASVLLVGAGGAARGALLPLAQAGCARIHIVNRTPTRAQDLVDAWNRDPVTRKLDTRLSAGDLASANAAEPWQLVINATASGLQNTAPELPTGIYAPDALAYDMMYGAHDTAFMRQAKADGAAHCADGLGMLVAQAAESFFIWHGIRPDPTPVLTALRAALLAEH